MPEIHDHADSENAALTLGETLPIPRRACVYALTCGCPDADGQLFWTIDTETRSYELVLAPDSAGLRTVRLTSEQRFGDGPTWAADFFVRDTLADWVQALARHVSRLTLADRSPLPFPD
ncbi:hypothetical protein [Streptomyces rhizosphaericus]|uniref:hypothetical protein n=1 Tax=Streptomyces rhizosphaericus TaxID=114699 RepID=UPI000A37C0B3|nr:hypothetical protein [Streptomyces rhizosphaericus]